MIFSYRTHKMSISSQIPAKAGSFSNPPENIYFPLNEYTSSQLLFYRELWSSDAHIGLWAKMLCVLILKVTLGLPVLWAKHGGILCTAHHAAAKRCWIMSARILEKKLDSWWTTGGVFVSVICRTWSTAHLKGQCLNPLYVQNLPVKYKFFFFHTSYVLFIYLFIFPIEDDQDNSE